LDHATPRERILEVAYALFSRGGVRGVGVDEVVDRAGVAKATLYRHFPTKDDLVLAFLALREERFTRDYIEREAERRGSTPEERLLAIFDVFDEWFHRDDFEACSFVNVLLELGREHPAGAASIRHLEHVRAFPERLAREAGLRDPSSFACAWHILMKGATIAAAEGDRRAASCAREVGQKMLAAAR
jgi:AcrR family transcriptional regulator